MEVNSYQIFVAPAAIEQIKNHLRESSDSYVRWGVKSGGCSGYIYVLKYETLPIKDRDILFEIDSVKIVIDNKSIHYLNGCTLDWEKTLMRRGFVFINPREKSKCGCGTSFSI